MVVLMIVLTIADSIGFAALLQERRQMRRLYAF